VAVKVTGGHKFEIALQSLAHKIGNTGTLKVGFLEGATYPATGKGKSLSVAQVAFWNEFGTKRAPARPFFRNTIAEQSAKWGRGLGKLVVSTNFDGAKALNLLGIEMKNDIVTSIVRWPADNAESTAARKGFNKGLIDTGVMQRNVGYKVET
jgi:hypothetical protein